MCTSAMTVCRKAFAARRCSNRSLHNFMATLTRSRRGLEANVSATTCTWYIDTLGQSKGVLKAKGPATTCTAYCGKSSRSTKSLTIAGQADVSKPAHDSSTGGAAIICDHLSANLPKAQGFILCHLLCFLGLGNTSDSADVSRLCQHRSLRNAIGQIHCSEFPPHPRPI